MNKMTALKLNNISKDFDGSTVLDGLSLELGKGMIGVLAGESGSGKTTIMRIIAGLESASSGDVTVSGYAAGSSIHKQGKVGLVFQDYALFPHLNVYKNITFGLHQLSKQEQQNRAEAVLELVNLDGLKHRYPHQLSGGQQQRIAIARALAPQPSIILFDEPFSNLDSIQKNKLREQIKVLIKQTKSTALVVTHDINDAMLLADEIFIIKKGKVLQSGSPESLRQSPATPYVEALINNDT